MKRNILKLLLSAAFVMCCTFSASAQLGTPPNDEIWYTSSDGSVIDPYDKNVFGATYKSNTYNDGKGVIKFNGPVTKVGDWAFYDTDLTSMSLPNSVKNIGYRAFYWMDYMTEISLGNSVETISNDAFRECDGLVTIAIPASVTSLGENAFYHCNVLKFVAIGRGLTSIGNYAFYDCNELKSVAIDGNVSRLGYEAFYHCDKLESVSFLGDTPPSSYGDYCFSNCSSNLKYHVLEEYYDRYNSISVLSWNVVKGPPYNEIWYTTNNGGTAGYIGVMGTLPPLNAYMGNHGVQFFNGNPPEFDYKHNCFNNCSNLVSAILPSSINSIGDEAFRNCSNLVSVELPSSITSIGEYAFNNCSNLVSVELPSSITSIGDQAFRNCSNLVSVELPSSTTSIGIYSFYQCSNLVSVSIPSAVTSIGEFAFAYCSRIQTITIPNGVDKISNYTFGGCNNLRSVTILGTIKNVGEWAFNDCWNLCDIFYFGNGTPSVVTGTYGSFFSCPATIYVKDATGHSDWGGRPVRSWRSGKGDGSRDNPLEIENHLNLYGFALEVNILGSNGLCGKLTSDIVGNSNVLKADGSLNGTPSKEWLPIGSSDKVFCGEFNGNGHTISGLYHNHYDGGSCVGLFGRTGDGAYIHDLGLVDSYMSGGGLNGGICGDLAYGLIDNCYNAATVAWGGGVAGWCRESASITNCHNVGHIFSQGSGIVDAVFRNPNVTYSVENCYALEGVSNSAINNNYGAINKVEVKNATAFASGEVCWLLNGSKADTKWRQQLGKDSYPVLSGNYIVNNDAEDYHNETVCEVADDHLHNLNKVAVNKCDGSIFFYWHCSECDKNYTYADKTEEEVADSIMVHRPEDVHAIIPTATTEGRYEYYQCAKCHRMFKDELCSESWTNDSEITIPKAKDNEIWYTTSNHQKLTPYKTDVFGVAYNDANNVYEYGLGVIRFDGNVTSIGNVAFLNCERLTSITIPNSVTSIGESAFGSCDLTSITIPESVMSIRNSTFFHCDQLSSVTIPSSVMSIEEDAFQFCQGLTSITIPISVMSIEGQAFYFCDGLTSITFQSLPTVGTEAFAFCDKLSAKSLDLTDSDKPFIGTSLENYPGFTEAHYHGTLEPNQWGTITLPFVPSSHSGIVFFSIDNVDAANGTLTLSITENIEAGKPYLFRNQTDNAGFTLTATPAAPATNVPVTITASDQTVGDFALKGSFKADELTENGLYKQQGGEFVHTNSLSIDPFRAYLKDTGSSALTRIVIGGVAFVKITEHDDSTVTIYGVKEVGFVEENDMPAVRVTRINDSTNTYTNPKKVDFGK